MRRGLWFILIGIAFNFLGYYLMEGEAFKYVGQ